MNTIAKRNGDLTLPGFTLTQTGLTVEGEPSFDQWQQAGKTLRQLDGALHWWIGDWLRFGKSQKNWGEMYSGEVEKLGFDEKTLRNYVWLTDKFELSLRRDNLDKSHHEMVAAIDEPERSEWLDQAEAEGGSVKELRQALRDKRKAEAIKAAGKYPSGKFRVILADPPWAYGDERTGLEGYTSANDHYPTQSAEDLCDLSDSDGKHVRELAGDDAVLFMWVPAPLLGEAFPVVAAWGFRHVAHFVWDKVRHNFGNYLSVRHELLLLCTRGSCLPESSELLDSVVSIERDDKHSHKPEQFCEHIHQLYPTGPRIELFARNTRPGWTSWGNEVT